MSLPDRGPCPEVKVAEAAAAAVTAAAAACCSITVVGASASRDMDTPAIMPVGLVLSVLFMLLNPGFGLPSSWGKSLGTENSG